MTLCTLQVLVRGGLQGDRWEALRAHWTRANFAAKFALDEFSKSPIPYAEAFGLHSNTSTIGQHLEYMTWLQTPREQTPAYVPVNCNRAPATTHVFKVERAVWPPYRSVI